MTDLILCCHFPVSASEPAVTQRCRASARCFSQPQKQAEHRNKAPARGLLMPFVKMLMHAVLKEMLVQEGAGCAVWTGTIPLAWPAHPVGPDGGGDRSEVEVTQLFTAAAKERWLDFPCETFFAFRCQMLAGSGQLWWIHSFKMQLENYQTSHLPTFPFWVGEKKCHRQFQKVKLLLPEVSSLIGWVLNRGKPRASGRLMYFFLLLVNWQSTAWGSWGARERRERAFVGGGLCPEEPGRTGMVCPCCSLLWCCSKKRHFCQHPSLCTRMWLCQECTLWFLYRPAALSEQRASLASAKMAFLMQMLSVRERSVMLGAVCLWAPFHRWVHGGPWGSACCWVAGSGPQLLVPWGVSAGGKGSS